MSKVTHAEDSSRGGGALDRWVLRFAGSVVLISLALSQLHSIHWLWLTAFVGANLLQASFTGFCPLAALLRRVGVRPGAAFYPGEAGGAP